MTRAAVVRLLAFAAFLAIVAVVAALAGRASGVDVDTGEMEHAAAIAR